MRHNNQCKIVSNKTHPRKNFFVYETNIRQLKVICILIHMYLPILNMEIWLAWQMAGQSSSCDSDGMIICTYVRSYQSTSYDSNCIILRTYDRSYQSTLSYSNGVILITELDFYIIDINKRIYKLKWDTFVATKISVDEKKFWKSMNSHLFFTILYYTFYSDLYSSQSI